MVIRHRPSLSNGSNAISSSCHCTSKLCPRGDAPMDQAIIDEILEELSSTLQRVEAQSAAILEFVKEKGMVKEDELAPFLERANAASSVRWRATRVRLQRLLSGLEQKQQQQLDEERKRVEAKHETGENNAGETEGQKAVAKPEAQTGKPQREEEKH